VTAPAVRVEERHSPDSRCAYCHDAMAGEVATCACCGVTCHPDCRAELGGCPTLGCVEARRGPARAAARARPPRPEAIAALESLLRRSLLTQALFLGPKALLALVVLVVASSLGPIGALVVAVIAAVFLFASLGTLRRARRARRSIPMFAALPAVPMTLVAREIVEGTSVRYVGRLTDARGGGVNLALEKGALVAPGWVHDAREHPVPVRVRWLDPRGPFLVESERGDLALLEAGWRRD
jgi:hypothetical protein